VSSYNSNSNLSPSYHPIIHGLQEGVDFFRLTLVSLTHYSARFEPCHSSQVWLEGEGKQAPLHILLWCVVVHHLCFLASTWKLKLLFWFTCHISMPYPPHPSTCSFCPPSNPCSVPPSHQTSTPPRKSRVFDLSFRPAALDGKKRQCCACAFIYLRLHQIRFLLKWRAKGVSKFLPSARATKYTSVCQKA
jgi:hypothetical protein